MLDFRLKTFILLILLLWVTACGLTTKENTIIKETQEYIGWWVYG